MKKHYVLGVDIKPLSKPFDNYSITDEGVLFKDSRKYNKVMEIISKPRKKDGYHSITLRSNCGAVTDKYLHRIVLEAFVGISNLEGNHKDGDKSNNWLANLEYLTRSENQLHKHRVLRTGTGTEKPVMRSDGKAYPSIASVEKDGFRATGVYKVCAGQMNNHKGYGWTYV